MCLIQGPTLYKNMHVIGEHYHIYNRGAHKAPIFNDPSDYDRFVSLLYVANTSEKLVFSKIQEDVFSSERSDTLVNIFAYCLMPNHFHILATPLVNGGLSKFMLKLQTGYSMYFNIKNRRNGSLFQGPFKSEHADTDT